ncbi:YbhB/YbcL family Raf kinase inhibitor-like protein [Ramlibacter sp. AW1]|uniref:YbhB/YbcL family Raf kinase inhibitor-like protein n=1 Tax=Ramlibacter aurantiacus TaxID=2801330 RepID=A0A936ZEM2_9BURK|nr:YbhB/YbcL family Raf kinase inhibitor-like protein [Ramlibacter aurantiacus]MBL0418873.1 YbhB/YbcL family Raf kinase inhibitor-like protein [Ramlibacter aurantiacus]
METTHARGPDIPTSLTITSSSIADGRIQRVHACREQGGEDQSLSLTVHGLPPETRFLCVIVDDPDAMKPTGKVWVHWNVFNIETRGEMVDFRAGQPLGGEVGLNSSGQAAYQGMCPPDGRHTYRLAVFASRERLQVDTSKPWTLDDFQRAYGNRTIGSAQVSAQFGGD